MSLVNSDFRPIGSIFPQILVDDALQKNSEKPPQWQRVRVQQFLVLRMFVVFVTHVRIMNPEGTVLFIFKWITFATHDGVPARRMAKDRWSLVIAWAGTPGAKSIVLSYIIVCEDLDTATM